MFGKILLITAFFLINVKIRQFDICKEDNEYLDINDFTCKKCPLNSVINSQKCQCDKNSIQEYGFFDYKNGCIKCGNNQTSNQIQNKCMKCQDCDCDKPNQFKQDTDTSGKLLDEIQCITCSKGYRADKIQQICIKMDEGQFYDLDGQLQCLEGFVQYQNNCFTEQMYSDLNKKFSFEQNGQNQLIKSIYLSENILFQALSCLQNTILENKLNCENIYSYCQAQDFNEQIQVCQLYSYIEQNYPKKEIDQNLHNQITFLDYKQDLNFISLQNNNLQLYVYNYDYHDQPQLVEQFQNVLTLCNQEFVLTQNKNDVWSCSKTVKQMSQIQRFNQSFYIKDSDGQLQLIPILFVQQSQEFNYSYDKLTEMQQRQKLTFLENKIFSQNNQQTITFIKRSQLRVTKSEGNKYSLTLIVQQQNILLEQLNDTTQNIKFEIIYDQQNSKLITVIKYTFGFLHLIIVVVWIIKGIIWNKQHPEINYGNDWFFYTLVNWFWILVKIWSIVVFIYIVTIALFQLFFYHFSVIQLFQILNHNLYARYYLAMKIILLIASLFLLLEIFIKIRNVSNNETILIDWERKKVQVELQNELLDIKDKENLQTKKKIKSAWRKLLVANEYHELSLQRRYHIEFILALFLYLTNTNYIQNLQIESIDSKNTQKNELFVFATNFIIFFIIFSIYYILLSFYENLRGDAVADFLDLITISNISIVCFNSKIHGYYLHGQNNTGTSEGDFLELKKNLKKEEKGYLGKRGLLDFDKNELQTFEIFIPYNFRIFLDQVFHQELKKQLQQKQYQGNYYSQTYQNQNLFEKNNFNSLQQNFNNNQNILQKQFIQEPLPLDLNFKKIFEKQMIVTNAFKKILFNIKQNKDTCLDKSFMHKFLNYPQLYQTVLDNQTILYKDYQQRFRSLMFLGQEFTILFFEMILFLSLNSFIKNEIITTLVTYVLDIFYQEKLFEKLFNK